MTMTGMSSSSSWPTSLASAKCRVVVDRNELFEAVFTQNGEDKGGQSNGYNDNDKNQGVHLHLFLQLFLVLMRLEDNYWFLSSNSFFYFKVWVFWKGHKIWKNLRRNFDKSIVFCAQNSVLVKKSTKIFKNKCGQVVLYKVKKLMRF